MENNRKEGEEDRLQPQAVWFAAGTAVAVAFLQRASLVSLAEQWRVWVFVALNLLLLAILFTSNGDSVSTLPGGGGESNASGKDDVDERKKRKECSPTASVVEGEGDRVKLPKCQSESESGGRELEREAVEDEEEEKAAAMSKEELNERVEAFIAMFRQQLVSDAKHRNRRLRSSAAARPTHNA